MAVIVKHARDIPEPPSTRSELEIPAELERIVMACLEKEPEKRPQSAVDLARRLDEVDLDQPWTDQRAVAWWDQHLPARIGA